ncbi:copine-8 isoform X5 [Puntigrus tetrazona]|uniref:copine-8 isoform X5 n=1 Tax=Puntigrus tetrazona TaxID=1606681 RepID=UPI001C8A3EB7|nr:copine-8 isoform X5 [Puntigrus tetrazona]
MSTVMSGLVNMASLADFEPLAAVIPATKVEITVSCRNLLDRDTFSKSDPICVLYTQTVANREWREFGRTEVIDNTLNPDFVHKFILDYFFEERQNLRFDLYDLDSKSENLSKHDFLGQMYCTLGEVVGSQGSRMERSLVLVFFFLSSISYFYSILVPFVVSALSIDSLPFMSCLMSSALSRFFSSNISCLMSSPLILFSSYLALSHFFSYLVFL